MAFTETEIRHNLWCFEQRGVRCFLAIGSKEALLVDSCYEGDLYEICRLKTNKPIKLVLTHGDADHTGNIDQFTEKYINSAEYSHFKLKNNRDVSFKYIEEGNTFDTGTFRFTVISIPGHTPGGIALLEEKMHFLIGGDSVQTGPIYMFGKGRNIEQYLSSMKKLKNMSHMFDVVYSSHNDMEVPVFAIEELEKFAEEIISGNRPKALPAPDYLPDNVALYKKDRVSFYLEKPF